MFFFLQIYHPSVTEIGHFASPDFCFHSRKPDIGLLVESPGHPGMVLGLPPKPPPESHHLTIGQLRTTQPAPISRKSQVKIRVDHRVEHHWRYHCWLVIRCFFMIYPTLVIPIYYPCWIPVKHIYEIQLNSIKSPLVKEAWYKHVGSGPSSWSFAASASSSASVLRIDIVQKKTCGKSHPASD